MSTQNEQVRVDQMENFRPIMVSLEDLKKIFESGTNEKVTAALEAAGIVFGKTEVSVCYLNEGKDGKSYRNFNKGIVKSLDKDGNITITAKQVDKTYQIGDKGSIEVMQLGQAFAHARFKNDMTFQNQPFFKSYPKEEYKKNLGKLLAGGRPYWESAGGRQGIKVVEETAANGKKTYRLRPGTFEAKREKLEVPAVYKVETGTGVLSALISEGQRADLLGGKSVKVQFQVKEEGKDVLTIEGDLRVDKLMNKIFHSLPREKKVKNDVKQGEGQVKKESNSQTIKSTEKEKVKRGPKLKA